MLQDKEAYLAGERAAMTRALQLILPSQQAIGMLSSGLQRLEARVQEEAGHSRQSQLATADCRSVMQASLRCLECCFRHSACQYACEANLYHTYKPHVWLCTSLSSTKLLSLYALCQHETVAFSTTANWLIWTISHTVLFLEAPETH